MRIKKDILLSPEQARALIDKNMSEKAFQAMVVEYAKSQGWRVYKTWTSIHSPAGFPDLTLVRKRKDSPSYELIFMEVKRQGGLARGAQIEWLLDLRMVCEHVKAFLIRPSDWDDIVKLLAR